MRRKRMLTIVGLVLATLLGVMLGIQTRQRVPKGAAPHQFVVHYPESLSFSDLEKRAITSRKGMILGVMPDPVDAAERIKLLRPVFATAKLPAGAETEDVAALCYLESGGKWDAMALAAGVAQFMPSTARGYGLRVNNRQAKRLLGQRVVLRRQLRIKEAIAASRGEIANIAVVKLRRQIEALESTLIRVDQRFDVEKAIPAMAQYLGDHFAHYGRWDFTLASYHAGQGNIDRVLRLYVQDKKWQWLGAKKTIATHKLSWTQVVFESVPSIAPRAYTKLRGLLDQSWDYYWRIKAARELLSLHRQNPTGFQELVATFHNRIRRWQLAPELQWYAKGSPIVREWTTWEDLQRSYQTGELVRFPDGERFEALFGIEVSRGIGSHASNTVPREVYRGMRPEAAGLALYLGGAFRKETGNHQARLVLTSLVRSLAYQEIFRNKGMSPSEYSCHCAGLSFDIAPQKTPQEKKILELVLQDLLYRGAIAWYKEGSHYHLTLSPGARRPFRQVWQEALAAWEEEKSPKLRPRLMAKRPVRAQQPSVPSWVWWMLGLFAYLLCFLVTLRLINQSVIVKSRRLATWRRLTLATFGPLTWGVLWLLGVGSKR